MTATLLFTLAAVCAGAPLPPPNLVRVAVVDTSGSMDGERLDTARNELLDLARKLPPAPNFPLIVIPFHEQVHDVRTFTDLASFETYMANLKADGGTSIAAGLERALAEINRYAGVKHVCVLLYTDGEDDDADGIRKQEEQLDRLFDKRSQQGLRQTLVFCKRWEQANAALLTRMAKSGHVDVIDAGELHLNPITIAPAVTLIQAEWSKDKPGVLDILLTGKIDVTGNAAALPPVRLSNRNPGAGGDVNMDLLPGKPTALTLHIPVPPEARAAGKFDLDFDLNQPSDIKSSKEILVPMMTLDHIRLPVPLPHGVLRGQLRASVAAGSPAWSDPLRRVAVLPLVLSCNLQWADASPPSVPFTIKADASTKIVEGESAFTVNNSGVVTVPLTFEAGPAALTKGSKDSFQVAFTVRPDKTLPYVILDPPDVRLVQAFAAPPPVRTTLTAKPRSVGKPHWVDLRNGIAAFEADFEFRVDGPLPPNAEITLQCPPGVHKVQLNPRKVTTGTQNIHLALEAELLPAPASKSLVFQILPPADQGAVRITASGPLRLKVTGPPRVQVVLLQEGRMSSKLEATVRDKDQPVALQVVPVVSGIDLPQQATGISADVRSDLTAGAPVQLPLYAPSELQLKTPDGMEVSFFRDSVLEVNMTVVPAPASPAVVGSRYNAVLVMEAPFKRLFFYLAVSLSAVLAVFFLVRMYLRLTAEEFRT